MLIDSTLAEVESPTIVLPLVSFPSSTNIQRQGQWAPGRDQYNPLIPSPPHTHHSTAPSTETGPLEPGKWLVNFLKDQIAFVYSFNLHQIVNRYLLGVYSVHWGIWWWTSLMRSLSLGGSGLDQLEKREKNKCINKGDHRLGPELCI